LKKKPKLLVIGDNCFDITVKSDFGFTKDRNFIPEYYVSKPAGTGVNFAVSFSELGGSAVYYTPISKDSFGREISNFLSEKGVDISGKRSDLPTALIIAVVNSEGERTTFALIKGTSYTEISLKEFVQADLTEFDGIYISGGINTEVETGEEVLKIAKFAKERYKKLYFDPQIRIGREIPGFIEISKEISELSDILFANEEEISNMGEGIFKNRIIIEKRGKNGAAVFKNGREIFSVPGLRVRAKDTTGAGDAFNAAFLLNFLSGGSLEDSLIFGNKAGAVSVSKEGAYSPSFEEVENFDYEE
jgi:ribokinase